MQASLTNMAGMGLALMIASSAMAEAVKPSTYVCVEERSVGWEPREGKSEYVGQFQPKPVPKIVKYYSSGGFNMTNVFAPGHIEVTTNGQTETFESARCRDVASYMARDKRAGIELPLEHYQEMCDPSIDDEIIFGSINRAFYFTESLSTGKKTIRYREHLLVGIVWAYVQMGTCTLFEG